MMKKFVLMFVSLISMVAMADEKSLYHFSWLDKDKEIYVLQNRKFRKDGRLYLGATGVKTVSGAFIDSYGGTARGGYFFREDWGVEFVYGMGSGTENDTAKGVREQSTVPYYRKVDSYMGGMVMWSPFYSKINTFNRIFYFDWMLGLGAASVSTSDNRKKFEPGAPNTLTKESNMGILWNTGLRFYISESWSLRLDFTGLHYSAKKSKQSGGAGSNVTKADKLFSNYDMGVGLNYSF
jgi:outer membrane beta-barrel protein